MRLAKCPGRMFLYRDHPLPYLIPILWWFHPLGPEFISFLGDKIKGVTCV